MNISQIGVSQKLITDFLDEKTWVTIGTGIIKIIIIVAVANIIIRIGKVTIHNIFKIRDRSPLRTSERREETLSKLLDNVLSYVIYFIVFMMILSVLGIDVKALLAGAGIVGLAIGFGAQSLVKDILSGFFIIFEDQFSVGDHIRVGQFEGDVEAIGLRTTKIKSWTGELHILPNGSINQVTNFSLNNSVAAIDVAIAYEEDIERAERVIQELLEKLPEQYEDLVKTPDLLGIQNLGPSEIVLRIVAETLPMKHFYIARIIRKEIKLKLDENGIEIPFPRVVMYTRDGEQQKEPSV
ncbi:mechanosensitive ion channel family protein [Neobacillus sp. PS3-12]|jgi:moderate conductance mechanosensitive channel|uniref:mechanosensitive ion channel family protein n=1 Tax=Neobacillus sp. PS3-12 TaxID=3070677 RepID=UPI0027E15F34|nr:mechanosensitive ion channel family protein [Neobacillus sp. PS3-12]WML55436.1 mechanosensitive ion channel family protein [Neobacillus sp. PS3-12]